MDSVSFLKDNAPHVLRDYENLSIAVLRLKVDLRNVVKDGNNKLIDDAIIWHVTEFLKCKIPVCPECEGIFDMDSEYPEFVCRQCGLVADIDKVMS